MTQEWYAEFEKRSKLLHEKWARSPGETRAFLIHTGILTKNGKLAKPYAPTAAELKVVRTQAKK